MPAPPDIAVRLLGPVSLRGRASGFTALPSTGSNLVLALATAPGRSLSIAALVAEVWPEAAPRNGKAALQTVVSRSRALTAPDLLASTPGGYRLCAAKDEVDLLVAERSLTLARHLISRGEAQGANDLASSALELWSGEPATGATNARLLAEVADRAGRTQHGLRLVLAETLIATGRSEEGLALLAPSASAEPLNDQVALLTARALLAVGRTSEAIALCAEFRLRVRNELGIDPSPRLAALHEALLAGAAPDADRPPTVLPRRGIPRILGETIGREDAVRECLRAIDATPIIELTGLGGVGKSRLAHAVATTQNTRAVIWLSLSGIRTRADLTFGLASALAITGPLADGPAGLPTTVLDALGAHDTLLVLDDAGAAGPERNGWIEELCHAVPSLRVLITSRMRTGLAGREIPVPPLPNRTDDGDPGPAVVLFRSLALAVRPDVRLDPDEVAHLCDRLEGIPLALELATSRLRTMTVREVTEGLTDRFALLSDPVPRGAESRATLRDVLEWTWGQLDPDTHTLCRRLAHLPGGFDRSTAQAMARADPERVGADVDAIVGAGLATALEDPVTGGMRYRLSTFAAQFAREHLPDGERASTSRATCVWARALAQELLPMLAGPFQPVAFRRLALDRENLSHALQVATERAEPATWRAVSLLLAIDAGARDRTSDAFALLTAQPPTGGQAATPEAVLVETWFWMLRALAARGTGSNRIALTALAQLRTTVARAPAGVLPIAAHTLAGILLSSADAGHFLTAMSGQVASEDAATARLCALLLAFLADNSGLPDLAHDAAVTASDLARGAGDGWSEAIAARILGSLRPSGTTRRRRWYG